VTIEKFGYSFGFVGNMLYMMQQIAPGKYKMTHYAFATALMNLVLWPRRPSAGRSPIGSATSVFFVFVLVASIPSMIAAWMAPFPNAPDAERDDDGEGDGGGTPSRRSRRARGDLRSARRAPCT